MILNLLAEISAFCVLLVSIIGIVIDKTMTTTRHRVFKWLYYSALVTSFVTICAVLSADNIQTIPIQVVIIFRYLFYFAMPTAAIAALYYAISLVYTKTNSGNLLKRHFWGAFPYLVYVLLVISNIFHGQIFDISVVSGIVPGPFYRITYAIVVLYFVLTVGFIYVNRNSSRRKDLFIICLNLIVTAFVFCFQLFFPKIQMSGIASALGIMVIHLYIQNTSKLTDELTELYNRQALTLQLIKLCNKKKAFSLYVISIRNFKGINERFGLDFGDALLETLSFSLRKQLPNQLIFRYTGDQFAALVEDDSVISDKIEEIISATYKIKGVSISLDMIYARVDYPTFGNNVKEIISAIDYSIATLKKIQGDTTYIYDITICDKMKRRNHIIECIKDAIDNNGFVPHYQPIYDVKTGKFTMAEALIRMKNSSIGPSEFIPIAEETGQIIKITLIMLDLVCADFRELNDKYGDSLSVESISVNFPYIQFLSSGIVDEVIKTIKKYHFTNDKIQIELTERALSSDLNGTRKVIDEMIQKGFVFELDDFGVEYSNLSMFFDMPIHIVKFDRSLVINFTADESRREFFKTFLEAVKSTNVKVIMEGVEEKELLQFLEECGCDYIQGYVFSKPLPLDEFSKFCVEREKVKLIDNTGSIV